MAKQKILKDWREKKTRSQTIEGKRKTNHKSKIVEIKEN